MEHWRGGCGHWRRRLEASLVSISDVSGCQHIMKVVASKYHISTGMNIHGIPMVAMSSPTPATDKVVEIAYSHVTKKDLQSKQHLERGATRSPKNMLSHILLPPLRNMHLLKTWVKDRQSIVVIFTSHS